MTPQSWDRREVLKAVSAAALIAAHARPAAAQSVKWSAGTEVPKLKVLVTSREALRLYGEHVVVVAREERLLFAAERDVGVGKVGHGADSLGRDGRGWKWTG